MKKVKQHKYILSFLSIFFILSTVLLIAQTTKPIKIKFGIFNSSYEVSGKFAVTEVMKLWMNTLKKASKDKDIAESEIETEFYSSKEELFRIIKDKSIDFININTWEYFKYNLKKDLNPMFIGARNKNSKYDTYYLVTQKNNPINGPSELEAGSEIFIPQSRYEILANNWAMVLVYESIGAKNYKKINIIKKYDNEKQALLAVFFGKTSYTVVHQAAYEVACQLNPQIRKNTKVISESEKYILFLLASRRGGDNKFYEKFFPEVTRLPLASEGKQMMEILQLDRIYKIEEHDLDNTENLFRKYNSYFK